MNRKEDDCPIKHTQILISYRDMSAEVDEMIAPLVKVMWEAGIKTIESCQGYDGVVSLYFDEVEHPRKFLEAIWEPESEELEVAGGELPIGYPFYKKWNTWLCPRWKDGVVDYLVSISFPQNEIVGFIRRIKNKHTNITTNRLKDI